MFSQFSVIEDRHEAKLKDEIRREQVRKVPLSEYGVGSQRYNALIAAMELAQKYQMPENYSFNV